MPQRCLLGHQMLEDLAQQEQTCTTTNAAVEVDVVGAIAGGTPHQIIVCHLVRHGDLRLMKIRQTNGNMKVKWESFRP